MSSDVDLRERLLETLDMFEFGVEMMASNLRRRHPEATSARIEQYVDEWLVARTEEHGEDERVVTDRYR